jgi:Tetracyclin repressor-like, C-terminal domain
MDRKQQKVHAKYGKEVFRMVAVRKEKKTGPKKAGRSSTASTAKTTVPLRRRGRPLGAESALLDRATILSIAVQLTKSVPLADISIIRVARELGVTPALIHYYMGGGGRHAVTSGVMNFFYGELVKDWPQNPGSDWRHYLEVVAGAVYRGFIRYPGVAAYAVSHNRFRMIQSTNKSDVDYGIEFFERFTQAIMAIGFNAQSTITYSHLLIEFIISSAHATVRHMWPGEHKEFLNKKLSALDPEQFPATHFVRESLINLNASEAFTIGLGLFLQALELNRENLGGDGAQVTRKRPSRAAHQGSLG